MTTNTAKGNEQVRITAFVEADPNAPAQATPATSSMLTAPAASAQRKFSTQPGHEGHNHD
jgi:hypothetical protein